MLPLSHYSFSDLPASLSLSLSLSSPSLGSPATIMLSSALLLVPSFTPTKFLRFDRIRRLPTSKDLILIRGSGSKRVLGGRVGRIGVSADQKNMPELVGVDAFRGGNGGGGEEAEALLRSGRGLGSRGFESTLNRMSKWLVACLFGLVILWKHDAEAMWAAMGSVVNSWIAITLKQILNHERPSPALRADPGMPSSHAQSIFYTACFAVLSLFHWLGTNAFTVSVGSTILICGSYLTWLRVSQQLHSTSQVVVGAVLGSACSITWFWMWHSFVLRAFISSIWVRMVVVLGSITFCAAFLLFVIQHWLKDEE